MNNEKVTHISYQTAKALIEFCPELPEPMGHDKYQDEYENPDTGRRELYPMYELCDLLSRPFCEAFEKAYEKAEHENSPFDPVELAHEMTRLYFNGGLPAVEDCLMKMIGGK